MTIGGDSTVPIGDRELIEEAVSAILTAVPPDWKQVHAEFEPTAQLAAATVTTGFAMQPLPVPQRTLDLVVEHQRRATARGHQWRRLVIDCHSDGQLAVVAHPVPHAVNAQPRRSDFRRRAALALAVTTAVCLGAAAVLFAVAWRWSPVPEADVIAVPPPPARQDESFAVITKWLDGANRSDVVAMRSVTCSRPAPGIERWIATIEQQGSTEAIFFPDAVSELVDDGSQIRVEIALRVRPLDARAQQLVEAEQDNGGFLFNKFTLVDENGLKVCDSDLAKD